MSRGPVSPAMAEHRRLVVWWLTGAGTLLVVLLVFGGYFFISTVESFVHTGAGCLPADFPNYPKATVVEVDLSLGTPVQGDTRDCRVRLASKDAYQSVNTFFRHRLDSGDWLYSRYSEDSGGSILAFHRRTRALTYGAVTMHKQAGGTPFEVELFS